MDNRTEAVFRIVDKRYYGNAKSLEALCDDRKVLFSEINDMVTDLSEEHYEVLKPIINQYCEICESLAMNRWDLDDDQFSFVEKLREFVEWGKKDKSVFELVGVLNCFARKWDETVLNQHYPQKTHKHVFFISRVQNSGNAAILFSQKQEPDDRLICIEIEVNTSKTNRLLISLHEMGHYIGCRDRKIREKLFIKLTAFSLINEVYLRCSAYKLHRDDIFSFPPKYCDDSGYSYSIRKYSVDIRQELIDCFKEVYEIIQSSYSVKGSRLYLNSIEQNMRSIFDTQLNEKIKTVLEKCKELSGLGINIHDMLSEIYKNVPALLSNISALLSEITADVFMIKVTKLSTASYIDNILNWVIDEWKRERGEIDPEEYCGFIANDVMRCRLLAVGAVNQASRGTMLVNRWDELMSTIRNRTVKKAALKMLNAMYIEYIRLEEERKDSQDYSDMNIFTNEVMWLRQDIWNPQHQLTRYTEDIYKKSEYVKMEQWADDELRRIRTIVKI